MKAVLYLLLVLVLGNINLNAMDWTELGATQYGLSTASIGWEKLDKGKLTGYHGLNIFTGVGTDGLEGTIGWGSSDYLVEFKENTLVPYWHCGVNILGSIDPYFRLGVEFQNKDGFYVSIQTFNVESIKIGGGIRL